MSEMRAWNFSYADVNILYLNRKFKAYILELDILCLVCSLLRFSCRSLWSWSAIHSMA
jgi:hypothetical protein